MFYQIGLWVILSSICLFRTAFAECRSDLDCETGQRCRLSSTNCTINEDGEELCEETDPMLGTCVPALDDCEVQSECPNHLTCIGLSESSTDELNREPNTCQYIPRTCDDDNVCPMHFTCNLELMECEPQRIDCTVDACPKDWSCRALENFELNCKEPEEKAGCGASYYTYTNICFPDRVSTVAYLDIELTEEGPRQSEEPPDVPPRNDEHSDEHADEANNDQADEANNDQANHQGNSPNDQMMRDNETTMNDEPEDDGCNTLVPYPSSLLSLLLLLLISLKFIRSTKLV